MHSIGYIQSKVFTWKVQEIQNPYSLNRWRTYEVIPHLPLARFHYYQSIRIYFHPIKANFN